MRISLAKICVANAAGKPRFGRSRLWEGQARNPIIDAASRMLMEGSQTSGQKVLLPSIMLFWTIEEIFRQCMIWSINNLWYRNSSWRPCLFFALFDSIDNDANGKDLLMVLHSLGWVSFLCAVFRLTRHEYHLRVVVACSNRAVYLTKACIVPNNT